MYCYKCNKDIQPTVKATTTTEVLDNSIQVFTVVDLFCSECGKELLYNTCSEYMDKLDFHD